jgi:Transposase, Mutator family
MSATWRYSLGSWFMIALDITVTFGPSYRQLCHPGTPRGASVDTARPLPLVLSIRLPLLSRYRAIVTDWDDWCQILAVEMANRESRSSCKDFLIQMTERGLHGVEFIVADDHAGLRAAIREVVPQAGYQRCYVHFLRMPSIACRRNTPTIACWNCAGSTTAEILTRRNPILPPGRLIPISDRFESSQNPS